MNHWIANWVVFCARHAKSVCLSFAVIGVALAIYALNNIGINTKTTDMLSAELDWRQNLIRHEQLFPHLTDTLVAVIDAQTPMLAMQARDQLAAELARYPDEFNEVYLPGGGDFFRRHGLLFLELDQLDELVDQLTQIQPFLGKLERGERLSGFFNLIEQSLRNPDQANAERTFDLIARTAATISSTQNDQFRRLRWGESDNRRQLIILKPKLVFEQVLPAKQSIERVEQVVAELDLVEAKGIRVRLTGTIGLQNDELTLLAGSMPLSGVIAFILVSLVLFFAMRHPVLMLSSVTTLMVGLIITAAFAAYAVTFLNLVSVAFALLFIGLGIDFAIHFCLRYKELLRQQIEHYKALQMAASDVGSSLVLCTITTSAGFFAFIPTSFKGVSELGVISGAGMYISLFATLSLLPALLSLAPIKTPNLYTPEQAKSGGRHGLFDRMLENPVTSARILAVFFSLIAIALPLSYWVKFDNNPINLRSPKSDSVSAYRDLLADSTTSPLALSAIANGDSLATLKHTLESLPSVERVLTIEDFVPTDQAVKLDLFVDLDFILGGAGQSSNTQESPRQQMGAIERLLQQLDQTTRSDALSEAQLATLKQLDDVLQTLLATLTDLPADAQQAQLETLSDRLLGDLLAQTALIRDGLASTGVDANALPEQLKKRWQTGADQYKLQIFPTENLQDNSAAARYVRAVTEHAPNAAGPAIVNLEGGLAIVQSFQQAFVSAFILIFFLLLILFRRLSDTLLVLTPLVLTAPLVVAITVLLGIPFNYANVITLPLLLGISVDNGVHMIHRARHSVGDKSQLLASSTGRAVVFSAVTTVVSFGNLAFSPHVGTASMGLLLTIGMICSLFCTLILLPILVNRFIRGSNT